MKTRITGGRRVLLITSALVFVLGLAGIYSETLAQKELPDLVPMGFQDFGVTMRLGGPTLEWSILTANIGGQDFIRPLNPDTGQFLLRQIYEWRLWLYNEETGEYDLVRVSRKNTICTIDDTRRGNVFPCLQEHGARYRCAPWPQQGVSRGWADDYFRGLNGQWIFIGDYTGYFVLETLLDADGDLQREDIPDSGRDGNPENNYAYIAFTWDGQTFELQEIQLSFDPDAVCPPSGCKELKE